MLRNLSIKNRLMVNSVVVGAAMLVMLLLLIFQNMQFTALAAINVEIAALERDVLVLRRHEKDFLMRKDLSYKDKFGKTMQELNQGLTLLERDFNFPPIAELYAEVAQIRQLQAAATPIRSYGT